MVKFWIGTKIRFDSWVWAFWCLCLCTWPTNFIWDEFWVWEDKYWRVWEKGFWNSKFFFWTVERSLKRALSEPQASVPRRFWTQFAWASCERTEMLLLNRVCLSELKCCFWTEFAWASSKRTRPEATETWSLKRTCNTPFTQHHNITYKSELFINNEVLHYHFLHLVNRLDVI